MRIEDKAKAFDEALERAKKLKETCDNTTVVGWCEYIFPELKSEDEKIRKDIMVLVKDWWDRVNRDNISTKEQMIDWLEKQGKLTQSVTKMSDKGWSEEDERMYKIALSCIETLEDMSNGKNMHADVKDWLKSLKTKL